MKLECEAKFFPWRFQDSYTICQEKINILRTFFNFTKPTLVVISFLRWNFRQLRSYHGRSQDFFSGGGNTFSKKFSKNSPKIIKKFWKKIKKEFKKIQKISKNIQKYSKKISKILKNFLKKFPKNALISLAPAGFFRGGEWDPPGEGLKGGSPRGGFRGRSPPDAGEVFKKFVKNQWKI